MKPVKKQQVDVMDDFYREWMSQIRKDVQPIAISFVMLKTKEGERVATFKAEYGDGDGEDDNKETIERLSAFLQPGEVMYTKTLHFSQEDLFSIKPGT